MTNAQSHTIPVDNLTDEELQGLEAQGIDTSGPTVTVRPQQSSMPAPEPVAEAPDAPKKVVEAPAPTPDVVARVKKRVEQQEALEGSSFEERDADGNVVDSRGEVVGGSSQVEEPVEDPIEAHDKANFLAHVLGGERFTKAYPLFNGHLIVTFRTRTSSEDEACARQSFDDEQLENGFGGSSPAVRDTQRIQRYLDYQFLGSLASLQFKDQPPRQFDAFTTPIRDGNEDKLGWSALRQARIDLYGEISQPLRFALRNMHGKFETLVSRLAQAAEQPDFWEADSAI